MRLKLDTTTRMWAVMCLADEVSCQRSVTPQLYGSRADAHYFGSSDGPIERVLVTVTRTPAKRGKPC